MAGKYSYRPFIPVGDQHRTDLATLQGAEHITQWRFSDTGDRLPGNQ